MTPPIWRMWKLHDSVRHLSPGPGVSVDAGILIPLDTKYALQKDSAAVWMVAIGEALADGVLTNPGPKFTDRYAHLSQQSG